MKKIAYKIAAVIFASAMLYTSAGAIDLYVDTKLINTDVPPQAIDGRTMVPVRAIFEALGATVEWDGETQTVTGQRGDTTVIMQLGSTTAYVNGEEKNLDVPAQAVEGRTLVPARFISEALGCDVTWYQDTQTAAVADVTKGQHIYVTKTGAKYHYSNSCNDGTYYEATLAEAMGRGLTPCEKCVLTSSETAIQAEEDNTLSVGDIVTLPEILYFDENGTVKEKGSLGFGSTDVMFFDVNGDVYISELTLTTFLANILEEYSVNDGKTVVTSDPNFKYIDYPNLSREYDNGNIVYSYKGITFAYSQSATGADNELGIQDGCRAINRMGGWIFNANDLVAHFGINKTVSYIDIDRRVILKDNNNDF